MRTRVCTFMMICLAVIAICLSNNVLKVEAAKSGSCGEHATYSLDDSGTLTISGSGAIKDYGLAGDYPWYEHRKDIKKLIVGEGITQIPSYAFYSYIQLEEAIIKGNTKIDNRVFQNCLAMTKVSLGGMVKNISGADAFRDCSSLATFTLLEGVGDSANAFYASGLAKDGIKLVDASGNDKTAYYAIDVITYKSPSANENEMIIEADLEKGTLEAIADQAWTGEEIKPIVTVIWNGQTVSAEKYDVSYSDNIEPGTATVTVTGKNSKYYTGRLTQTFQIKEPLTMNSVSAEDVTVIYDGQAHGIVVMGAPDSATITYSTSIDGTYSLEQPVIKNVADSGTIYYKVNAPGYKEFTGSAQVVISQRNLAECTVADIANRNYTGDVILPDVNVTYGAMTLQKDVDYTITGSSVNVGSGNVKLTGCGNFTGTNTKVFEIMPINMAALSVTIDASEGAFTNSEHNPFVNVLWNGTPLVEGTHYTVSWDKTPILAADTYTATIVCQGNFAGSTTQTYIVNAAQITNINVAHANILKYTGEPQQTLVHTSADVFYNQPVTFRYQEASSSEWGDLPMFTDAGQYVVSYEVSAPNHKTEYGDFVVTILEGENAWVSEPTVANWGYGENAKVTLGSAKFGTVSVHYVGTAKDGTLWDSSDEPTKVGDYTATFTVPATSNYSGLTLQIPFQIEKGTYDLSNTRWDYEGGFRYNGQERTVSVIHLPEGVTVASYTGEKGTDIAVYTATVTLNYDSYNYHEPVIEDLVWAINRPWDYNPQPTVPNEVVTPTEVTANQGTTPTASATYPVLSPNTGYSNTPYLAIALVFVSAAIVCGVLARKTKNTNIS